MFNGHDFVPIAHRGALTFSFERQQMVEAGALHLVSRAPTRRMLIAEIKFAVLFAAAEGGAVLELKPAFLHCAQHAGLF